MHRSHIRQKMKQKGMSGFMICCNFLFFFGNHAAVFLRTDSHFDECFLDICLLNICPAFFCCKNGSLIQQILQICSCKSRSRLCDLF